MVKLHAKEPRVKNSYRITFIAKSVAYKIREQNLYAYNLINSILYGDPYIRP